MVKKPLIISCQNGWCSIIWRPLYLNDFWAPILTYQMILAEIYQEDIWMEAPPWYHSVDKSSRLLVPFMKTLHLKKLQATYFYFYEPTHTCNLVKDFSKLYFVNPPQAPSSMKRRLVWIRSGNLHQRFPIFMFFGCCTCDSDAFVILVPGYLSQMASMLKIEDRVQWQKTPFFVIVQPSLWELAASFFFLSYQQNPNLSLMKIDMAMLLISRSHDDTFGIPSLCI